MVMLGTIAYFIRDWRNLQLALAIPTLLTLIYTWMFPESPKWYLAKNKKRDAFNVVVKIAKKNGDAEFFKEYNSMQMETYETNEKHDQEAAPLQIKGFEDEKHETASILDLFKNKILLKHSIVMITVFFSVTLSYYGILLYLPNLPGGRHLNFVLSASMKKIVIAYFVPIVD